LRSLVGHTSIALTSIGAYLKVPAEREDIASAADYYALVHPFASSAESTAGNEEAGRRAATELGSRKPTQSIADLRAIPWVLAWNQARVMLPGWYGTGSAFQQWIAAGPKSEGERVAILHDLYQRWPFFRSVLSNMAEALAKSDLGLAARYAELVPDESLRRRVFDKIADEHQRTIAMHKLITGQDNLLADNPALARSVFNRFPYLEPLNHLQVELLRRYRSGDDDELVQRGILLTMNGLARALRNSG
jgi:phosphoenolpyruvate carboxylase